VSYDHLINFLKSNPETKSVVILPDFFVDHFVITDTLSSFTTNLKRLAEQGGGNLLGTKHIIRRGGNTINTASALLKLGMNPTPIITTDKTGAELLKSLVDPSLDLTHIHTDGKLAATVSIELEYNSRPVNLMVSDSGSLIDFSYSRLTDEDIRVLSDADLVALLCLNHNKNGVSLARELFSMLKSNGKSLTLMDTGDPSGNPELIPSLTKDVLSEGLVDILGVNETEIGWFAAATSNDYTRWKLGKLEPHDWLRAAELVSREFNLRVDLHTPLFSASVSEVTTAVPAFISESHISCGAGDAWNAGNIYCTLHELPDNDRLVFANALATLYVSSAQAEHPSRSEIISFLQALPPVSVSASKLLKSELHKE